MTMKRLVIIADHSLVVQGIRSAVAHTGGFRVIGVLDGRASVRDDLRTLDADVVIVDEMRAFDDALARVRDVAETSPTAKVLLLTVALGDPLLDEAFKAGADAVFSKGMHPIALGTLLRETVRGNVVHRRRMPLATTWHAPLTQREVEILELAAQGHTNARIARQLWITEQTVKFHLSNTYRKLGVANRTEATRFAYTSGLVALTGAPAGNVTEDVAA